MFRSLRNRVHQVRQNNDLYFAALLPREAIQNAFGEAASRLDSARIYTTAVTVWTFLSQTLSSDHGCVQAVAKLIAYRVAGGQPACSAETGAYCIARDQLDEDATHRLVKQTGEQVEGNAPDSWLWLGHRIIIGDGCTVTMADTPENQTAYPQLKAQRPGCGFPIMRCVVLFALATGTVLETAMGTYRGKLSGEVSLFREIDEIIGENDVFLADRAYSGWFDCARLLTRGAHVVVRKHQARKTDFRTGKRLSKDDHIIVWDKPTRPKWMSCEEHLSYPDFITLREIRVRVQTPGLRTREMIVATSLLDNIAYSREDMAALYRRRWQAELHLRSLKSIMQMDHLRCKKPHRVRNELRMHLLAYNIIRQVLCEAAAGGSPWRISFKGTLSTLLEMLPILAAISDPTAFAEIIFVCCRTHEVGNRPDRFEPRVIKRRPKSYTFMTHPRSSYQPKRA